MAYRDRESSLPFYNDISRFTRDNKKEIIQNNMVSDDETPFRDPIQKFENKEIMIFYEYLSWIMCYDDSCKYYKFSKENNNWYFKPFIL